MASPPPPTITPPTKKPPPNPRDASISVRNYIYFLPYPIPPGISIPYTLGLPDTNPLKLPPHAFEPTSTLVLTAPGKTFVDVRVFRPIHPTDSPLPNTGGPLSRLDWAFSGTSSSTPISDPFSPPSSTTTTTTITSPSPNPPSPPRDWTNRVTHASWTHWLDSRHAVDTPPSQIPKDEGIMYALNEMQALEHGSGVSDAKTGAMGSYEEMWTDCEVLSCSGDGEGRGSGQEQGSKEGPKISITLRLDTPSQNIRGVVVRVGQFVQGIVMHGSDVTVERWEYIFPADSANMAAGGAEPPNEAVGNVNEKAKAKGNGTGQWRRTIRLGNGFLPCALTFKDDGAACVEGGDVEFKGVEWRVEEVVRWGDVVQFGV